MIRFYSAVALCVVGGFLLGAVAHGYALKYMCQTHDRIPLGSLTLICQPEPGDQ